MSAATPIFSETADDLFAGFAKIQGWLSADYVLPPDASTEVRGRPVEDYRTAKSFPATSEERVFGDALYASSLAANYEWKHARFRLINCRHWSGIMGLVLDTRDALRVSEALRLPETREMLLQFVRQALKTTTNDKPYGLAIYASRSSEQEPNTLLAFACVGLTAERTQLCEALSRAAHRLYPLHYPEMVAFECFIDGVDSLNGHRASIAYVSEKYLSLHLKAVADQRRRAGRWLSITGGYFHPALNVIAILVVALLAYGVVGLFASWPNSASAAAAGIILVWAVAILARFPVARRRHTFVVKE